MSDKFTELGIPSNEITPAISMAVNGLLEHIEQLNNSLIDVYDRMEKLQNLIDEETSPALPNRKSFLKRLDWTILLSHRISEPSSVVVIKIRDFSKMQDEYGFQASNASINHVARKLEDGVRDTDFFARIGNDEFAMLMFFADFDNAKLKAQRLCHNLANQPLFWNGDDIKFFCDFGVHQISKSDTAENALLAANNSLNVEKQKTSSDNLDLKS